jgi:hypothetical protein
VSRATRHGRGYDGSATLPGCGSPGSVGRRRTGRSGRPPRSRILQQLRPQNFGYMPLRPITGVSHGVVHGSRAIETKESCDHVRSATDVLAPRRREIKANTDRAFPSRAIVRGNRICRLPGAAVDPVGDDEDQSGLVVCLLRLGGSRLPLSLAADADVRPSCGRRGGRGRDREAVAGGPVCMVCRAAA